MSKIATPPPPTTNIAPPLSGVRTTPVKITQETLAVCPVCAGRIRSLDLTERYNVQRLRTSVEIHFAACTSCNFVLQSNLVVGDSLSQYYSESPRYRVPEVSLTEANLYSAQAAFMSASGNLKGARVLDISAEEYIRQVINAVRLPRSRGRMERTNSRQLTLP
jgi:hypothetical protein